VEVLSSKRFVHKRIGYLAASQIYRTDTDVLLLTTNQIKKDIGSQNQYEIGIALSGLAKFMSPDLARDLANDIITLTTSTRPYVRKLATLITYKVFLNFPDALRPTFQRLKEKLDDADQSVQSCAVNVICELARKNPRNYLSLAPIFFKLLQSSTNNWMRIKIIKLFAALCPIEPRLAKKLIDPLTSLIHQTPAMSLLYECINTVILGVPDHMPSIQLCVTKLRIFIEDQDQNLKYLGLQSMAKVLKIAPKAVAAHRDLIIRCLDDEDESIRVRALALIGRFYPPCLFVCLCVCVCSVFVGSHHHATHGSPPVPCKLARCWRSVLTSQTVCGLPISAAEARGLYMVHAMI
jgi:AP-3 complex subunit delta-1